MSVIRLRELPRSVNLHFIIDTNRINSRGQLQYMNRLERWRDNDVIHLTMAQPSHLEAMAGNDPHRRDKALQFVFHIPMPSTFEEQAKAREIAAVLFPNGPRNENEANDVWIAFTAAKYCRILVTNDGGSRRQPGGLLGHRDKLRALGVQVMRDDEAVVRVESAIARRDQLETKRAELAGRAPASWVGRD